MTDEKLKISLATILLEEGIGSVGLKRIYSEYKASGKIKYKLDMFKELKREIENRSVGVIGFWEKEYPQHLLQLSDHPVLLFYRGDLGLISLPKVTVVGTRRSSMYGIRTTRKICKYLSEKGICGVSGLAYGIDATVHTSMIKIDEGRTIAVVAGGIDQGYPLVNQHIYDDLSQKHLILSEFPPGRGVIKGMFPMRNRILAALSSHTIVIEAPASSGALITAHVAADLGREVSGVPGDIDRNNSKGVNQLIADGASVINSMLDIEEIALNCRIFFNT